MLKSLLNSLFKRFNHKRFNISIRHGQQLFSSQVHVAELANGIRVASQESDSFLACTSLFVKTGSRFENVCNHGITHFIEHLAYQGFNSLSKSKLQENIRSSGTKLTVQTTREYQVFTAMSSAENAIECVDVLLKILTDLELSDLEIELQKECVDSEAFDEDKNPKSVVFDYLKQTAFQGTSLGQSVIGPISNRKNFDRNMIRNFIADNYQPHRLLFVSTGRVSHKTNMCEINTRLANFTPFVSKCADPGPRRFTGSSIIYRDDSIPFAHVALGIEAPGYNSPEYLPLFVANCLTGSWERTQGGTDRHGSPLARAAATSKLCEKFESFYIAYQDTGLWGIYFVGDRMGLDDMIANIQDQWMQMCTTVGNSDIERAINLAKYKLANSRAGVIRSCKDIGLQLLYTSNWKSLAELFNDKNKLKNTDIKSLCSKYIYDKCPVIAAVGPTETLPDYNRIRAGMYWLRI
ncbi:jg26521 [Pararge aegeria aegeria]|uniref:Jg26521 protein n=1 Tax=Pararge aegeria aegeria TaxID=348720 RepID=A0A8S4QWZ7_9NEOP|nr:jg26521 [Pararge aegeria aegeria]